MAVEFIRKNDGLYYLRLTGITSAVYFAAAADAGNRYILDIQDLVGIGTAVRIRYNNPTADSGAYRSFGTNPIPNNSTLDDSRFSSSLYTTGANPPESTPMQINTQFFYPDILVGTREYRVNGFGSKVVSTNPIVFGDYFEYLSTVTNYGPSGPDNTQMVLGGESLAWTDTGNNPLYAFPGSGGISNARAVGIKVDGSWQASTNVYVKHLDSWRQALNIYVKQGGVWRLAYRNLGNSGWINLLENTDDALDFAVYAYEPWYWPSSDPLSIVGTGTNFTANSSIVGPVTTLSSQTLYITLSMGVTGSDTSGASVKLSRTFNATNPTPSYQTVLIGPRGPFGTGQPGVSTSIVTASLTPGMQIQFKAEFGIPVGGVGIQSAIVRLNSPTGRVLFYSSLTNP